MKITLSDIDPDNFIIREGDIAGEKVYLVFPPPIGIKWDKRSLIFRSSVWNKDGELISASFPKFFNWGEQPDLSHTPFSTTANGGINCMEKMDGSTLIVSKYKGQLITRTRGTFDATQLETGEEIQILKEIYPKAFEFKEETPNYSYIFEWESTKNVIVLNHKKTDIVLIGRISHDDYSLMTQRELDILAVKLGVRRPPRYHYNSISEMLDDVKTWEGKEGLCIYSNKDQSIRKVKSEWYLTLHRMKSELGSFGRVVDVFFVLDMPSYTDFYNQISEIYDFEIANLCIPHISIICDGWKIVGDIVKGMEQFVNNTLLTVQAKGGTSAIRKKQAELTFNAYGKTNRAGYVFSLLDGKGLDKDAYKKLLYQSIREPEEN